MADKGMAAGGSLDTWPASRAAALERLYTFVPRAGRDYAARRNHDNGVGRHTEVSCLSPYVRHRMLCEDEIVRAVLTSHSLEAAEKFIQEVCWRTYWKGWLEQHPAVWDEYLTAVDRWRAELADDAVLAGGVARAEAGATGLDCFDAWAHELTSTGYVHNHARMWFASIWIFTLRLPWELGANFFLRHLLDGDPASNTLSWRWVAGLHTRGKTYLACADNIARYTWGRFRPAPSDLAAVAPPLGTRETAAQKVPLSPPVRSPSKGRLLILVTEDDLTPEHWVIDSGRVVGVAMAKPSSGFRFADHVAQFRSNALADASARCRSHWKVAPNEVASAEQLVSAAAACKADSVVTSRLTIGFMRSEIDDWTPSIQAAGLGLVQITRPWDAEFWPHARAGYFRLKDRIQSVLDTLGVV
jgi:deoxyribodipyrimidine photo-lyase